jgi:hypothetical protein
MNDMPSHLPVVCSQKWIRSGTEVIRSRITCRRIRRAPPSIFPVKVISIPAWAVTLLPPSIFQSPGAGMGIPAKLNAHSEGKPNGIPG